MSDTPRTVERDPDIAAAERRGEARILQAIAKLPSPWTYQSWRFYGPKGEYSEVRYVCSWCGASEQYDMPGSAWVDNGCKPDRVTPHPANDCLYARALASARRTE